MTDYSPAGMAGLLQRAESFPDVGAVAVSIADAANPLVFVEARMVGLTGTELPRDIGNSGMLALLEAIRAAAAMGLGLVDDYRQACDITPGVPKMTIVAPPLDYVTATGEQISADAIELSHQNLRFTM